MNTSLNTTRNRKRVQGRPWRRAHRILLAGILLMCLLSTGTVAFSVRAAETDTSPEMVEFTADPASMPDDSTADDAIIAQEEGPEQTEIGEISAQETQTVLPLENGGLTESEDVSSVADGILMTALEDSVPAAEEDTTWQKDYYYTLYTGTGTIRLSQYTGNGADIVVPATATIDGVTYHTEIYEDVYSRKYSIRSVRFEDGVRAGTTLRGLFRWCFNLASVDLGNLDTSAVRDMSLMFSNCVQLRDLDLSMLDTSSVTNMSQMLINCYRLETLNVRGFNTSKVTTMWNMFSDCVHLRALDLSSFDTSSCTSMDGMFSVGLEQLTLGSNWAFRTSYAGLLGVWTDGTATYSAAELEQLAAEEVPGTYTRVSYGGVTRAADTPGQAEISLGEDYRQTAALTEADKADTAQRNGQVSDAADAAGGRLIKTVEWTDKDAGEASVGLEYAVPDLGTRAVYAFGTCNAHGFGADIAMTQILELLDQYDYVDILTSECQFWKYYYEGRDFMATAHKVQLTLSAADGRTANLQRLLALFSPDYSDVLNYNIINWGDHASGTILLRYLQDYLQERTPTAIYVACDGSRAFSNDTQPGSVETAASALYGCSRSRLIRKTYDDLQVDADTMRTLAEYQQNGRYYVCICKEEREYCVAYYDTHEDDEGSRLLCYASFALFNPDYYVNHHDELIAYLDSGERFGSRYYADFPNVGQALINYGTSFASQNIELAGVPLTMTDTVDEDLVIDEDDIAVSVTRDGIAVHDVADASVTVTGQEVRVEMPSVLTGEVVRVRIPLSLREGVTTYCSQEDGFRDTNVGDAVAAVEDYGSVSVASPRLYKGVDVEPEPEPEPVPEPAPEPEPEPEPVPEPETPDAEPEETGHETEHHRTVHHTTEEHRTVNTTVVNQTIVNPVEAVDAAIEPAATAAESANEAAAVGSEGPGPATGDDARMTRWFALFITASAALLVWIAVQVRRL